jgi:hypothetical protein
VALVVLACIASLLSACDSNDESTPDRDLIRSVVSDFFHASVNEDAEAICAMLTGPGRAQAAGHGQIIGRPRASVSEQRCVARGARAAIGSVDLPGVIDELRIVPLRIEGGRARVSVCFRGLCRPQRARKTEDGWKIDVFQLPVND